MAWAIWMLPGGLAGADSGWLYGIHWWGYTPGEGIDTNPATLLDCPTYGGWDLETVLTHSASWWAASYFTALYQDLYSNKNVTMITRIDYKWEDTVPAPASSDYAGWPNSCVSTVNTVHDWCHIWVIGNEPNILMDQYQSQWPERKVTPAGYATIYRNVRNAIHSSANPSPAGQHIVLIAPVSPGGVIAGVRWMDGNEWLSQVIDNIPSNEIDGFAMHSYGWGVTDFHDGYVSQLAVIDGKGLRDRPIYITEWNRYTDPNDPTQEAVTAQFCRDAFADVYNWNRTTGNHNIICLCWFVYDSDQQAGGGWNGHAIEYWRGAGYPLGDYRDLYTAFQQTVDLRYPAGAVGVPPLIERDPVSFTRTVYEGDNLTDDSFTVRNGGTGTMNYTITDNVGWLDVNPGSGSSSGEDDSISIIYDTDGLAIGGPYQGTITISSPQATNSPQTIAVSVTVTASPYAPADFDHDDDVDQIDLSTFLGCVTGPGLGPPTSNCVKTDLDEDNDVDQSDLGLFQRCLSGAGIHADPHCAD